MIKRSLKIVLGLIPVIIIAKVILSYMGGGKTYSSYVQEVLQGETVDTAAQGVVTQIRGNSGDPRDVDYAKMKADLASCMRSDMQSWLSSGDPRLHQKINKSDVPSLVQEFVSRCLTRLSDQK